MICCMDHSLTAIVILTKALTPQLLHSLSRLLLSPVVVVIQEVLPIRSEEVMVSVLRAETPYDVRISPTICSTFKKVL